MSFYWRHYQVSCSVTWSWSHFSSQGDVRPRIFGLSAGGFRLPCYRLLLAGELPLRYYSGNFALRKPSWSLPEVGGVQGMLTPGGPDVGLVRVQVAGDQVNSGGCWTGAGGTWT